MSGCKSAGMLVGAPRIGNAPYASPAIGLHASGEDFETKGKKITCVLALSARTLDASFAILDCACAGCDFENARGSTMRTVANKKRNNRRGVVTNFGSDFTTIKSSSFRRKKFLRRCRAARRARKMILRWQVRAAAIGANDVRSLDSFSRELEVDCNLIQSWDELYFPRRSFHRTSSTSRKLRHESLMGFTFDSVP